ncbi:MAG: ribulose-phosphate 3-epimerase [Candidatus Brockarchaeota archaeon]|nr:ribulose-phosphate 3-epimerase [Candidatus Brockarchaeota archaeon]
MRVKIAASILSADYGHLASEVEAAEEAGADMIHFDVMDGRFVPNITFGHGVVDALRKVCSLPFHVHLMVADPERQVKNFVSAGADVLVFHLEASKKPSSTVRLIKRLGADAGVSLNPSTDLKRARGVLGEIDDLLLMTVRPGSAGQKLIPSVLAKVRDARKAILSCGSGASITVDGGINPETAPLAVEAGASTLVAGSAIFSRGSVKRAMRDLRRSISRINRTW